MKPFARERAAFDLWARWIERDHAEAILKHWYPKQDCTSRISTYGVRSGTDGRALEAAPQVYIQEAQERARHYARLLREADEGLCEQVDAFMAKQRGLNPLRHLCLEARHRRVIGTLRLGYSRDRNGRRVPMKESEVAAVCIKAGTEAGRLMAFRRQCEAGYAALATEILT